MLPTFRHLSAILVAALTVVSLSACGGGASEAATAAGPAIVDITPPEIWIDEQAQAALPAAAQLQLSGGASDNLGVEAITWESDRGGDGTAKITGSGTRTSWSIVGISLQEGINTITITAQDVSGNTASTHLQVQYGDVTASPPTVTLTRDAASVASGGNTVLRWSATDASSCTAEGAWSGSRPTSGSETTAALTSDATYTLQCTGAGGSASATVTVNVLAPPPAPTVTLTADSTSLAAGGSTTLRWNSSNSTSCTAGGSWSGSKALSGSQATGSLSASSTYTLTCTGSGGTATATVSVAVQAPSPAPTVSLTSDATTVVAGSGTTLRWSTANATSCTASGGWSGSKALGGSELTPALSSSTTFTLSCTGAGGTSSASTSVTVQAPPTPTVTLSADNANVPYGGTTVLRWSSTNATSCTASGAWSGTKSTGGAEETAALTTSPTFTLTCSGAGGSRSASVGVSVLAAPAPVVTITADSASVPAGGTTVLRWNATNATSCSASGAWSGTKSTSGSQTTSAINAASSYTLACSGPGGSASDSTTVSVQSSSPAPTVTLTADSTVIAPNTTTVLRWTSTNATSCVASNGWGGNKATSGSEVTGTLSAGKTYVLTCSGTGGSASSSVAVSIQSSTPTVSLTADSTSVAPGGSTLLRWSSTNATSCTAGGAWSGTVSTSGTQSTGALSTSSTYTINCTNGTSSANASVSVAVQTAAPTVTLSADSTAVSSGGTTVLRWSSTNAGSCTASGAWTGSKVTSGSETTAALSATSTFSLNCTGGGGSATASTTVTVTGTSARTGLDFPSNNNGNNAFVAFQFLNPQNNGLPIWGPGNAGATYVWRVMPRQQTGYYVTFWWSNNGSFLWKSGSPDSYYGGHPYPTTANASGTSHWWELATGSGGDYTVTNAGTRKDVVKGAWYTQALRVVVNADGTRTLTFYTSLPSLAASDVITKTLPASYGVTQPPAPAITFGDSPWWQSFQHERLSGILRGIKIFNKALSESDTVAEAAAESLVTSEGQSNVWYMNINPTPNDISDKSGRGHHPAWADPANRATLWTE